MVSFLQWAGLLLRRVWQVSVCSFLLPPLVLAGRFAKDHHVESRPVVTFVILATRVPLLARTVKKMVAFVAIGRYCCVGN